MVRWLQCLVMRVPQQTSCRNVLFIKLAEQGSTVLAHDAIERAVEMVGRNHVYLLAFEENRHVIDVMGQIPEENVLTLSTRSLVDVVSSFVRRMREIRRLKIQVSIDLEFFSRATAVISWLSGAAYRIGFYSRSSGTFRGDLLTHRVNFDPSLHTASSFQMLVAALVAAFPEQSRRETKSSHGHPLARYEPSWAEQNQMKGLLASLDAIEGAPIILLNANAGDLLPQRRWPGENYVSLAKRLLAEWPNALILFTGSSEEVDAVGILARAVGSARCHSVAGKTSLSELLTLYLMADVLVTNDSGPAHFAAFTDIEVVTLFGPETPALFAARTPRSHVIWARLPCSPCVNAFNQRQTSCRNNLCLQNISVEQVYRNVIGLCRRRSLIAND